MTVSTPFLPPPEPPRTRSSTSEVDLPTFSSGPAALIADLGEQNAEQFLASAPVENPADSDEEVIEALHHGPTTVNFCEYN
jgi:hypothetical protein